MQGAVQGDPCPPPSHPAGLLPSFQPGQTDEQQQWCQQEDSSETDLPSEEHEAAQWFRLIQTTNLGRFHAFLFCLRVAIIVGYSYSENKTCSEKSMARASNGRMYTYEKVMG